MTCHRGCIQSGVAVPGRAAERDTGSKGGMTPQQRNTVEAVTGVEPAWTGLQPAT